MKEPMVISWRVSTHPAAARSHCGRCRQAGYSFHIIRELITLAAKKSGLTEEAIAASENQRSGSLDSAKPGVHDGQHDALADQVYISLSNVIKELAAAVGPLRHSGLLR